MSQPLAKTRPDRRLRTRVFRSTRNGIPASSGLSEAARAVLAETIGVMSDADPARLDVDESVGALLRMLLQTVLNGPARPRSAAANDTRLESPWRASFDALDAEAFAVALRELEAAGFVRRANGELFLNLTLIEAVTKQRTERRIRGIVSTGDMRTNKRPVVQKKIA